MGLDVEIITDDIKTMPSDNNKQTKDK